MFRSGLLSTRRTPYRTLSGSAAVQYRYNGILDAVGHRGYGLFGDTLTSGKGAYCISSTYGPNATCCGTDSYGNPNDCTYYLIGPEGAVSSSTDSLLVRSGSDGYATQSNAGRYYGFADIAAPTQPGTAFPGNGSGCNCSNLTTDWNNTANYGNAAILGIRFDNTLWGWGTNFYGVLGTSDTISRNSPTQIGSSANWKKIRANYTHVLALKQDGTLWAWGNNGWGQLGLGDTSDRSSPVQIGSGTWNDINAGANFSTAIKSDGSIWAWGYNSAYQLGDGTTTNRSSPVQVSSAGAVFTAVFGSDSNTYTSFAISSSGALFSWGSNAYLQTGTGYSTYVTSPTQVAGTYSSGWRSVFSALTFTYSYPSTYGITNDNKLYGWGYYPYGLIATAWVSPTQIGGNTRNYILPYGGNMPFEVGGKQGISVITTEGNISTYYTNGSNKSLVYSGKGSGGVTAITTNRAATYILKTTNLR